MKQREKSYSIDMCTGVIWKKMLLFALPLMCSSVLQLLFNAADIVVVGRFAGDNSLAAVGSNASLINLLTNLFIGLSVGANVVAAKFFGSRDEQNLSRTVHTAMLLSLVSGALLAVVGAVGARQILIWMQSPENVLPLATLYLRIYFLGMPATMIYNFGSALLRSIGDTKRPLHYLFLAGVVNVVLNLFFVISLRMDVAGVALATVLSKTISAGLILRCLIRETGGIHLDLRQLRFHKTCFRQILQVGLPAGMQGILFAISNVVIQASVNSFGEVISCYPAIRAISNYRIAHKLLTLGVPLIPRIITELAHSETGIDIHPGAKIGSYFTIDHGTGVVIGETCIIGNHVKLYQGVTLGARSFPLDDEGKPIKGIPRHPILEDDVIVYSNATILGRITIGRGATVGGNIWVTEDVPAGARITQRK